jgi:hypothetical protein
MWRQVNRSHLDAGEAGIGARAALAEPADGKMHGEREQAKPTHRAELRALQLVRSVGSTLGESQAHDDPPCCVVCYRAFCRDRRRNQPILRGRIDSLNRNPKDMGTGGRAQTRALAA